MQVRVIDYTAVTQEECAHFVFLGHSGDEMRKSTTGHAAHNPSFLFSEDFEKR